MEDQIQHPTPEELEAFLDSTEDLSDLAVEEPTPIRWYSLRDGRIITETCNDKIAAWVLPEPDVMTRDELDGRTLAAWEWSDRLYLTTMPEPGCHPVSDPTACLHSPQGYSVVRAR